jgi:hypothetical protein
LDVSLLKVGCILWLISERWKKVKRFDAQQNNSIADEIKLKKKHLAKKKFVDLRRLAN